MRLGPSVADKTVEGKSRETALKLKAMPATRVTVRRGVGRQQVSPDDLKAVERLCVIFFLFLRAHGEKSRGDDHRKKNAGKNEIVDHLGGCSFIRAASAVSMEQSSAGGVRHRHSTLADGDNTKVVKGGRLGAKSQEPGVED